MWKLDIGYLVKAQQQFYLKPYKCCYTFDRLSENLFSQTFARHVRMKLKIQQFRLICINGNLKYIFRGNSLYIKHNNQSKYHTNKTCCIITQRPSQFTLAFETLRQDTCFPPHLNARRIGNFNFQPSACASKPKQRGRKSPLLLFPRCVYIQFVARRALFLKLARVRS